MAELATDFDILALANLVAQMAEETPNFPAKSFDHAYFIRSLRMIVKNDSTAVIKENLNGSTVGVMIVGISYWPFSQNYKVASDILIYVDKEHRGKGVAGILISKAKEWAESKGADVLTLGNSAGITTEDVYQQMLASLGFKLRGGLYSCAVGS